MAHPNSFYVKLPKVIVDVSLALQKMCSEKSISWEGIMEYYFADFWPGFVAFWRKSGETPEWVTFALAPHNALWFIQWTFKEYPHVMADVVNGMNKNDANALKDIKYAEYLDKRLNTVEWRKF